MEQMLVWSESRPEYRRMALLWLFTYAFLLRLPSEALPAVAGTCSSAVVLSREGDLLRLSLARRKNKPAGSVLQRGCWCRESRRTCPVHTLGPLVEATKAGHKLFEG